MYTPSERILGKYADVLVNFGLNGGKGLRKGEVVLVKTSLIALPLAKKVHLAILQKGGYPLIKIQDNDFTKAELQHASIPQLAFFPEKYYRGLADTIDHSISIVGDEDPNYLKGIDPARMSLMGKSVKKYRDWIHAKGDQGKYSWTLALYGTEGMAKEAGLSLEEYWGQIKKACFLNKKDPVGEWRRIMKEQVRVMSKLNSMPIEKLILRAEGAFGLACYETDLHMTLGKHRKWVGGGGCNIPSFEIFTSPDWRGTNGTISFDMPLYYYGNIIRGIRLVFKGGRVVEATAKENQKLLKEMVSQRGADRIGEFSLTDKRFSRISKFMATTLYDENFGGKHGNTHIALGSSFHKTCSMDITKMTAKQFRELGFNASVIHTDIIDSTDRTVWAILKDGSAGIIYEKGKFTI